MDNCGTWHVTKLCITSLKFLSALKSPGLGPNWHTFRRVADEASNAETALSGTEQ